MTLVLFCRTKLSKIITYAVGEVAVFQGCDQKIKSEINLLSLAVIFHQNPAGQPESANVCFLYSYLVC